MAKILYGVAGEGFGHSSRSELTGRYLIDAGHDVVFAASHKSFNYLRQLFNSRVKPVHGLRFYYHDGRVDPFRTVLQNLSSYRKGREINQCLFSEIAQEFRPDLVISDFEPFSAWWAWRNRVPCISIDHEHLLTCCAVETERALWKERTMAQIVTRGYHTFADAYIVLNFFKVPVKNRSASLVPPVVRNAVLQTHIRYGEHILVYSTDSGDLIKKRLFDILSRCVEYRFYIYGFDLAEERGNCLFKKTSTKFFLNDLASCRAMVATAGFSLLSECIHFRKPMLLMPVRDQYEQAVNAYYVHKLRMGQRINILTVEVLRSFLDQIEIFSFNHPSIVFPDNAEYFRTLNHIFHKLGVSTL
ncbi:MAG: hypothetical protein JXB18_06135 [Sedimentisphaerales bacterium]|nr:hypothetical protein [Sedimentisphaerales bacterium]